MQRKRKRRKSIFSLQETSKRFEYVERLKFKNTKTNWFLTYIQNGGMPTCVSDCIIFLDKLDFDSLPSLHHRLCIITFKNTLNGKFFLCMGRIIFLLCGGAPPGIVLDYSEISRQAAGHRRILEDCASVMLRSMSGSGVCLARISFGTCFTLSC